MGLAPLLGYSELQPSPLLPLASIQSHHSSHKIHSDPDNFLGDVLTPTSIRRQPIKRSELSYFSRRRRSPGHPGPLLFPFARVLLLQRWSTALSCDVAVMCMCCCTGQPRGRWDGGTLHRALRHPRLYTIATPCEATPVSEWQLSETWWRLSPPLPSTLRPWQQDLARRGVWGLGRRFRQREMLIDKVRWLALPCSSNRDVLADGKHQSFLIGQMFL
jgi:hypothetical protein